MSDIKKLFIITIASCLLSVANISYRVFQDVQKAKEEKKEASIQLVKDGKWDVLLLKKDNPESLGEISGFLEKMNITKADKVIFGFIAKKDPNKRWDESLIYEKEGGGPPDITIPKITN
jgi:hypothetical protein